LKLSRAIVSSLNTFRKCVVDSGVSCRLLSTQLLRLNASRPSVEHRIIEACSGLCFLLPRSFVPSFVYVVRIGIVFRISRGSMLCILGRESSHCISQHRQAITDLLSSQSLKFGMSSSACAISTRQQNAQSEVVRPHNKEYDSVQQTQTVTQTHHAPHLLRC